MALKLLVFLAIIIFQPVCLMAIKCISVAFNGVLNTVILAAINGILIGVEMLIPH